MVPTGAGVPFPPPGRCPGLHQGDQVINKAICRGGCGFSSSSCRHGGTVQDPRRSAASGKGWPEGRYHHQCLGYGALRGASLRQPLCGRADCGNPGATPTQGLRAVPGGAWTGPWVVLGKSQARGA